MGVVVKACPLVEQVEHLEGEGVVYGIQNLKAFVALVEGVEGGWVLRVMGGEGLEGLPEVLLDF